jgi:signal peptidase I
MLPYLLLISYFLVLYASLWKLLVKAGRKAWEGLVPFYNFWVWAKVIGKPWYWLLVLLVPGVNLLMLIIMNVNLSIVFGERTIRQHVLATLAPWWVLPRLAFGPSTYIGPLQGKPQRGVLGQWGDAILFAVIVATAFRTFTFEMFTIPTPSMEKSLLVGDYLAVSKLSYGPRLPMTPMTVPFTHHTIPGLNSPSFNTWFAQPYRRLPGLSKVERGDPVVFNFPEGDTVVENFQNQSYYQLVRDNGRKRVHDPNFRLPNMVDGQVRMMPMGRILVRPLDKKENYIKRCVAIAGDTVEVRDGVLFVNGDRQNFPAQAQYAYEFMLKDRLNERMMKEQYDVNPDDLQPGEHGGVSIPLTEAHAAKLQNAPMVLRMQRQVRPRGATNPYHKLPIFPNHPAFDWTEDNFGPLWIPRKGATISLTTANLPLYARAIEVYETRSAHRRRQDLH